MLNQLDGGTHFETLNILLKCLKKIVQTRLLANNDVVPFIQNGQMAALQLFLLQYKFIKSITFVLRIVLFIEQAQYNQT